MKNKLILSSASVIAGVLNGFIGTGGGIILYFTLKFLNKNSDADDSGADNSGKMKDILAMIVASVIPMSVISAVIYMIQGRIIYGALAVYLPAALTGGIIGAFLLDKLKFKLIKKIFAAMIIYAGIKMILG